MAYLDNNGLLYLWNKIKSTFVKQVSGKGLSTNDYTTAEKNKLGGIASGAEVNQYAFSNVKVGSTTVAADTKTDTLELVAGSNVTLTPDAINDKVTIAAKDTTYNDFKIPTIAEEGKSGLVPAPPASGFYKILMGHGWASTSLTAHERSDGINIALNSVENPETITSVEITNATDEQHGFMSATDKAKLDGIEEGANNFVHPSYTSKASGLYKVTVDNKGHVSAATTVVKSDITGLGIPAQDTTYADMKGATSSAAGTHGLVPAPAAGSQSTKYLRADGTWQTPPDTKFTHPSGDGNLHVPATGTANNGKVLKAGATAGSLSWGTLTKADVGLGSTANGAEVNQNAFSNIKVSYSSGESGTIRATGKTDTLEIANGTNISIGYDEASKGIVISGDYKDFTGATTTAAGKNGLVPAPAAGKQTQYLRGDGTWATPTNTTYSVATQSANGLMSSTDKKKLDGFKDASTYALKSDITGMYKYKGSVADATKLPTTGQTTGDVYNIETASAYGGAGMNVAWDGSKWDPLGEIFTITSITNSEIDTICV
jgi:hypothetical protein|uniref:Tail fiber protein n=1 Tax=Siphoviridae sp. ctWDo30 TaxID=2826360 RepID=A0A8S5N6K2_9CAUD|nr:MAG TPA: hypothetical protein [Siphoviridae sp. ctWDo30]